MMPCFCHRNRSTKMPDKGERCSYLNSGNNNSSDTLKVVTSAGIATYSAHFTFGYRRQAFQGEVQTWGGVAVTSSRPWLSTASSPGAAPDPSTATTSSRDTGGASRSMWGGGHSSYVFIGSGGAAGESWISSRGEGVPPAFSSARVPDAAAALRGGVIPPMSSSRAAATSAAAATSSRGGGDRWHTCKREQIRTSGGSGCVAYATRIRPFRWSWSSYGRTFSDGAGAGAAGGEWWV